MDELNTWPAKNEKFLSAALTWLRLRLAEYIERPPQPQPAALSPTSPGSSGGSLFSWMQSDASPAEPAVETNVTRAAKAMAEAGASDPPPALLILANRLGLSRFEQDILLLCAAAALDTRIAHLCARAQDDPNRPYPTFALALSLFAQPAWDALSPERPLRYWRLLEINQSGAQPLTISPLRADERIVNYLKGLNYLDDRLAPFLAPLAIDAQIDALPPSHQAAVDTIVKRLEQYQNGAPLPVIQLLGVDSPSKQLAATRIAANFDLQLYHLPTELMPVQLAELETLIRLWERESRLLPVALYLNTPEIDSAAPSAEQTRAIHQFIARADSLLFWDTRALRPALSRPTLSFDVDKPTPGEQQVAWETILGISDNALPARLAEQFNLNLVDIHRVARMMGKTEASNGHSRAEQLWDACLTATRPQLDKLAQRIDAKATWSDIVLTEENLTLLKQIAAQVGQRSRVYETWGFRQKMNRGLGISALFAGESGTGKTMAAEVIANELKLNLYRIDLSAVVDKYIGETEKNLRRLFDAAENGGAILFFDEADALFGKRSEVKDSHDRYANIEINYLLQRIESYRGLAILATNMKKSLDAAFLRRLRFIVNFPFPSVAERKQIWQKVFPPETPLKDPDYSRLARLNLTGGSIHNIALNAAFLAAARNTAVTMPLLLDAARAEFRKLERPINEAGFRWNGDSE